jgi:nucleotide-binding universal stress UspA family protein
MAASKRPAPDLRSTARRRPKAHAGDAHHGRGNGTSAGDRRTPVAAPAGSQRRPWPAARRSGASAAGVRPSRLVDAGATAPAGASPALKAYFARRAGADPLAGAAPVEEPTSGPELLVPLDGTADSAVAIAPARALVAAAGARLTLLRAVPAGHGDEGAAAEYLRRVAAGLTSNGVLCEAVVRAGEPAETIVAEARERRCELIVMATHGRSGIGRAVLGSVAEGVLAGGRTPVLLVRPGGHPVSSIRTLLVPLDGSPGGSIALGLALALGRATGAALVLVQVVVPLPLQPHAVDASSGASGWEWDPSWDEQAVAAARVYVDGMAERLRHAGVKADGRAVVAERGQDVAGVVNATAEAVDADVVVMSTHALTGPVRTLFGSVTDKVVRTGRRGVLLIRRDAPFVDRAHHPAATADGSTNGRKRRR